MFGKYKRKGKAVSETLAVDSTGKVAAAAGG